MISKRVLVIAALLLVVSATTAMAASVTVTSFVASNLSITSDSTLQDGLWGIVTTSAGTAATNPIGTGGSSATGVIGYVKAGFGSGQWTGTGGAILNDSARASAVAGSIPTKSVYGLAPLTGAEWKTLKGATTTFYGNDLNTTTANTYALLQYTYAADVNCSGMVDTADLNKVRNSIKGTPVPPVKDWVNGDLNYSGTVDTADLNIVRNFISYKNAQIAAGHALPALVIGTAAAGSAAAVPEPSTILLGLFALACFLGYRKVSK
jgi:hypothetical protein